MIKRIRDSQRSKLYKAERNVWWFHGAGAEEKSLGEIKDLVKEILTSRWYGNYWQNLPECDVEASRNKRGPIEHIHVLDGRGRRRARGGRPLGALRGSIALPRWARNRWIMLHEIAHVFQTEEPSHGRQFARIYLDLVKRWISPGASKLLRDSYRTHKVKYMAKRPGQGLRELPPWLQAATPKPKKEME